MHEYASPVLAWDTVATVIDCGAHVGSFSLWAGMRAPCRILAIEPNPHTFALLQANVAGQLDRTSLKRAAIAGSTDLRVLHDSGFSPAASLFTTQDSLEHFSVETVTIEDLLEQSGFETVDILKIDVEGAEQEVFQSVSMATLHRIRFVMIECHRYLGTDVAMIERRLTDAGMQVLSEDRHGTGDLLMLVAWRDTPGQR